MLSPHDLPEPLLLDVLEYLQPVDVIRCRAVSSPLYRVLTTQDVCRHLLLSFFPCALEGRLLRALYKAEHESTLDVRDSKDWSAIFSSVARRYHRLATARPGNITSITPLKDPELLRGITPWHRFLRRPEVMGPDRVTPLQYFDPAWTYSREQGLLIYPDADFRYRVLDVATGLEVVVPFDTQDKIVRRASLDEGVLVLEWAERSAFHELNATEVAHRHFATAFDVHKLANPYDLLQDLYGPDRRDGPAAKTTLALRCSLDVTFRVEWKIHYLGLPISDQDRFFSTHNSTHYALYVWQPNRSPYWEDEPLERLIIWDIRPPQTTPTADPSLSHTPEIALRLTNAELAPWRARQLDTPLVRSLSLDRNTVDPITRAPTGHVHIHHEDHPWVSGSHAPPVPTAAHAVSTTSIPLLGHGPSWHASCVHELGSARSCPHAPYEDEPSASQPLEGGYTWPGAAPCWRHGDGLAITVAEVVDPHAGVRVAASTDLETKNICTRVPPGLRVSTPAGGEVDGEGDSCADPVFGHEVWTRLMAKGVLAGDERWVIGEDEDGDITIMKF